MTFNFSEKKKETIILLGIAVFIVSLIAWFSYDTFRLKTEKPQTTAQKKKKPAPQPSASVVHKKIDAPATGTESSPEIKAVPKEPEDKPTDKTVTETTADESTGAPSSDTLEPGEESDESDANTLTDKPSEPEEGDEVTQAPDKTADKVETETSDENDLKETGEEKPSTEDEAPAISDASELAESSFRMRQSLHPYSIKLSSNRSKRSAQNGVKVLKNEKTDPYVVEMDLGKERGIWWNVYTGHFKTKKDALNVLKTLDRTDALIKKLPYANLIDEFSSEEKMATVYQRLEKQGYDPYVIHDSGKWRLFVGDFIYVEGAAQRNQKHLETAGFASRIVKR